VKGECPHHPVGQYRECYHVGDDFVEVHWAEWLEDWVVRRGTMGKRGAVSTRATAFEVDYMLESIGWKGIVR